MFRAEIVYFYLLSERWKFKISIHFQFGHQENSSGQEILNALKHVRPGNGFEFKGEMFDKVATVWREVFGDNDDLFRLKQTVKMSIHCLLF